MPTCLVLGIKRIGFGRYKCNRRRCLICQKWLAISIRDCHCHNRKKAPVVNKRARNKLIVASVMSVVFIIAELVGGILANSLAIASDAAHLLADLVSFVISLLAIHLASRRATKNLSFGWHRAEILGALISMFLLWMITCVLCYVAIQRVIQKDFDVNATIMLITASCGVAFNLVMMLALHPGGHHHSHNSDNMESTNTWTSDSDKEKLTLSASKEDKNPCYGGLSINEQGADNEAGDKKHSHKANINVLASFLHVLGDLLQSIGVLVAAIIIFFKPEWKLADPVCTFLFSVIVICTTLPVMKDIFTVLMEGTPKHLDYQMIQKKLRDIPEVREIHDLRIWSLSLDKVAMSVHFTVGETANPTAVLRHASTLIRTEFDIAEINIQIEEHMADMANCTHCNELKN